MKVHIILKDGKLKAVPNLPGKPSDFKYFKTDQMWHEANAQYIKEYNEAIANALPVLNPELFWYGKVKLDGHEEPYLWPGEAELTEKTVTGYTGSSGNIEMDADVPIGYKLHLPSSESEQKEQSLQDKREEQKRTAWIKNVMRILGYTQELAEAQWNKIYASKPEPADEPKQLLNVLKTLIHRSLQWEDGEIKGWDETMVDSLAPILLKPFLQDEKQLADLRASYDSLYEVHQTLKADNERLSKQNKDLTLAINIMESPGNTFKTQLERRWPSEDEIDNAADPIFMSSESFKLGVNWLKSYLENK